MRDGHFFRLSASIKHFIALIIIACLLPVGLGIAQAQNTAGQTNAPSVADAKTGGLAYARPYQPEHMQEYFNYGIGKINNVMATVSFFDISFGYFLKDKVDENNNPVYKQEPVTEITTEALTVYKLGADNKPMMDSEGAILTVVPPGTEVYRMENGQVAMTATDEVVREGQTVPFIVIFLAGGAVFFTIWHGFINIRGFKHAVDIVRGKFTDANDPGDVTPFRALTSALSATVGLGNIAGVAIAVKVGGPGAIFWMMFLGLFGMTAKFHESTLAQMFRRTNEDGSVSGGPMFYIDEGLKRKGLSFIGKPLAILFAVLCMGAAIGGGNMFQANQAYEGFFDTFVKESVVDKTTREMRSQNELRNLLTDEQLTALRESKFKDNPDMPLEEVRENLSPRAVVLTVKPEQVAQTLDPAILQAEAQNNAALKSRVSIGFGMVMATLIGVVVIGGITRIGAATARIVPTMCIIYLAGCLFVIFFNMDQIPSHIGSIFTGAFGLGATDALYGGFIGALIQGFRRAAFSSEAGLGSSAIAHSAAKQRYPVREGLVASLEPFIDTIVICFMTAMVVLITDAYSAPRFADVENGAAITLFAFQQTRLEHIFPYILAVSIILFAFSTQISWCYYGERAYQYLFGLRTVVIFRLVFVICAFVGTVASLGPVLDFSDFMLLSMCFPNIVGGILLAGLVRKQLRQYWQRYKSGTLDDDTRNQGADI